MAKYFEEYTCGCLSKPSSKRSLLGYCPTHGADRRYIHPDGGIAQEAVDKVAEAKAEAKRPPPCLH